jgi:polysaccharide export outer membrane protein
MLSFLTGCAILPGQYASYGKQAEVRESAEEPNEVDYTLLQVTPLLVRELLEEEKADQFSIKGDLPKPKVPSYPYRLGPQDVVSIVVWDYGELGGQALPSQATVGTGGAVSTASGTSGGGGGRVVDPSGNVYVPLIGKVRAQGRTLNEFRQELIRRFSAYIKDPQIEINVVAYRSQKVFVAGEVGLPGVVPITDQPLTLVDALSQVGGPTEEADFYDVRLTRGDKRVSLNIDRLYFDGDTKINVLLQDGDVISVPDKLDRKVFILGEVGNSSGGNQARAYVMRRGRMSLTEVLADAGGINPFTGASTQVYVLRTNPNIESPTQAASNPLVYRLDARNPDSLVLADQFPMQARDVVFVNPTGPAVIGRFIGQFLPFYSHAVTVSDNPF